MAFDFVIGGFVAVGLTCYLLYALIRPDRF